ncbi:hypothetical protein [Caballeronia sp. S22]|uniref:hypothetical protein n=1 Tax=Caballeronia sp. S22 TaxID=3137182 RepID=UPI00353107B7
MERHLAAMLDALVAYGSTALAIRPRAPIHQHGRPLCTAVTFRMVTEAAQRPHCRRMPITRLARGFFRAWHAA